MIDYTLGAVEGKFADIVWSHEPLSSRELALFAEETLSWKRTTSYTVLRKLCDKGLFQNNNGTVTSIVSRDEYYGSQGRQLISEAFGGSLPLFLAAFTNGKQLTAEEAAALQKLIDGSREGQA